MRSLIVFGGLFVVTHLIHFFDMHESWSVMFHLEDAGVLAAVREAMLLMGLVGLVDWVFMPRVNLAELILGGGETESLDPAIRAATIRAGSPLWPPLSSRSR